MSRKSLRTATLVGLAGLLAIAAAVALLAGRFLPAVVMAERWVADYRVATLLPVAHQHPDIVVVAVTEDTLEQFPYRSPIDRDFLADLLTTLEARGVRAIGIDLLFDQPTEGPKDDRLKAVIRGLRTPTVISYATAADGLTERQAEYLEEFVPEALRGFANLAKDPFDEAARWIFPGRTTPEGTFRPGAMALLATKLGVTVPNGQVPIAWRGRPDSETPPFRIIPAHAAGLVPTSWLKDKIVLVGSDLSLTDRHRTPFSVTEGSMAGVVVHAHSLATFLDGRPGPDWPGWVLIAVVLGSVVIGGLTAFVPLPLHFRLLGAGIVVLGGWITGFAIFRETGVMLPLVTPTLAFGIATWVAEVHVSRQERQQRQFVRQAFAQYISPDLVDQLVADPSKLALHGEKRELSFLFTDVAGFTALAEKLDPDAMTRLLNQYLDGVCRAIHEHGGTVCDFIGDAVFAVFGAPVHQMDHAARAVACARAIGSATHEFQQAKLAEGLAFGITRIGVHSGTVTVGNVGSSFRFKYAPVGDAVNTASRLEGLNKHFSTQTCVSAAALSESEKLKARPLGKIVVKGRKEAVEVFELLEDIISGSDYNRRYRKAYGLLARGEADVALREFEALHRENSQDHCVSLHLERIRAGHRNTIIVMSEK